MCPPEERLKLRPQPIPAVCRVVGAACQIFALFLALLQWPIPAFASESEWEQANALVAAIGGWRVYSQERGDAPQGYPMPPASDEALDVAEVLAAAPSLETEAMLAGQKTSRSAERSASLAPPTLTYAHTESEEETSFEYGVHLPIGSWLGRARSLAADTEQWGQAQAELLRRQVQRERLVAYASAIRAKVELAQAMDQREIQMILQELVSRQRDVAAVPEADLLSQRMDTASAEDGVDTARELYLQSAEILTMAMGLPLEFAPRIGARLPMELPASPNFPAVDGDVRLDLQMAEDALRQGETSQSRARVNHWLGGLELGLIQEHANSEVVSRTVEVSWRLPIGGPTSQQSDLAERSVHQRRLQLDVLRRAAEREQGALGRIREQALRQAKRASAAMTDAEYWMEEQLYRYNGMLIGPHDLLRASARFKSVHRRLIQAQQAAFMAELNAHYGRIIPLQIPAMPSPSAPAAASDAGH